MKSIPRSFTTSKAILSVNKILRELPRYHLRVEYATPGYQTKEVQSDPFPWNEDGPTQILQHIQDEDASQKIAIYGVAPSGFDVHEGEVLFIEPSMDVPVTYLTLQGPHLSIFIKTPIQSFTNKIVAPEDFMDELKNL